ncbi:PREDICTED: uncharacterized protein LOC106817657 [Priapulus caudatus]|uniref:Uncharacterized protein LOC106817657 n=1 Tax=Priapulus caudatus TaxID=37621 RepID=A0ABM1F059_PRICU|nr:PREDICTED: uncharacterized protein LOC106817657 [Priapulus caudatus]
MALLHCIAVLQELGMLCQRATPARIPTEQPLSGQRKSLPNPTVDIERSTLDEPYYEATLGGSTGRADSGAGSTEGAFARVFCADLPCLTRCSYKKHRDQVKRLQVVPRYEPVYIDAPFETKPQIPPTYAEPQVAPPYPEPPHVAPPHVAPPHVAPPYPEHIHGYETQELGMFVPEGDTSAHTDPNTSYRPTTPPNPNVTYGPPQTTTTTTMAGARVQPPDQRKDIPYVETALEQKVRLSSEFKSMRYREFGLMCAEASRTGQGMASAWRTRRQVRH